MSMAKTVRYPIGEQDFKELRDAGCVYADKTAFIEKIIKSGMKYFFLARPRRFGKSLFLSTLRYFFEGRRELFENLHIYEADWNWEEFPVLHLDLNTDRYSEPGQLDGVLANLFREWEEKYGIEAKDIQYSQRLRSIIRAAHEKTGKKVVILVDEYDKPLAGNLNKKENFEHYRTLLASLYSNFKSSAEHLRLVFLTGVSRFSRLSVFSDLNNLNDISFDEEFADICGITEEELEQYFSTSINELAAASGTSPEETCRLLKRNYDGYRFAKKGSEIYNPWSLLNCLSKKKIEDYWNETGMPTILAESLKRVRADLKETFDSYCTEGELKGLDLLNPNPKALLYQTGYLTIRGFDEFMGEYHLGIPNREVKRGLFNYLLPYYVRCASGTPDEKVAGIVRNFMTGKPDEAMSYM